MNILIISQCNKRALQETRRVLDHFAERKGVRTWQTAITQEGLKTLHKMLRKSARRNTAVACHWIKSNGKTELLWIVGNISRFNINGTIPTNTTENNVLRSEYENSWHSLNIIALLAAIAGLFHDWGKANTLFQDKLSKVNTKRYEPYRHEWVSLRLFEAFVNGRKDQDWLEELANLTAKDQPELLNQLIRDDPHESKDSPFSHLPPTARIVGWLIVSHHRLPKYQKHNNNEPKIKCSDNWLFREFDASWNTRQALNDDWKQEDINKVWRFKQGLPIQSEQWCQKANSIAKKALKDPNLLSKSLDWFDDRFTLHIARLVLMLSDHLYSSRAPNEEWQSASYHAYANLDKHDQFKQKLDEHNVGVGHHAYIIARVLPKWLKQLPTITRHKGFKVRSTNKKFRWQDWAYELACGIQQPSKQQGFFGVNMASTGYGKTLANARIMYGLTNESTGARFNVALGLRTLTLQTADALRERLHLDDQDMAVLIGSQASTILHEQNKQQNQSDDDHLGRYLGSESSEDLMEMGQYIRYEGQMDDTWLGEWLSSSNQSKTRQMLDAPVLVSTIDHLMPATEGDRGGKQIGPMLRLLTSDLVLDEPDDFGLADYHALTRLVNWAGMLGSRVLLSSATLPPSLLEGLFEAYYAGRQIYNKACGELAGEQPVICAWFDETTKPQKRYHQNKEAFREDHKAFVDRRIDKLKNYEPLRRGEIETLTPPSGLSKHQAIETLSQTILHKAQQLHDCHKQHNAAINKNISVGLVRMANINPLVAVSKELIKQAMPSNYRLHFCIYHSHFPLLVRSKMERELDNVLKRNDAEAIWHIPSIKQSIQNTTEENHIFIVLATAVAEVGRDHDYDWAIAEPSSMRSIIQLVGRVQRHRRQVPTAPNFIILNQNYKALTGCEVAFTKPGFEDNDEFLLESKKIDDIMTPEEYETVSAIPRIHEHESLYKNKRLVDLEHAHMRAELFSKSISAKSWWQSPDLTWSAELQRRRPFRQSAPQSEYFLYFEDEHEQPQFYWQDRHKHLHCCESYLFEHLQELELGASVQPWLSCYDLQLLIFQQAEELNMTASQACLKFACISLPRQEDDNELWYYHPWLGVHKLLM